MTSPNGSSPPAISPASPGPAAIPPPGPWPPARPGRLAGGTGAATKGPRPSVQPMAASRSRCSARSIPSATTAMPRSLPTRTSALIRISAAASTPRPATRSGPIRTRSTGCWPSRASEPYPAAETSTASRTPRSRSSPRPRRTASPPSPSTGEGTSRMSASGASPLTASASRTESANGPPSWLARQRSHRRASQPSRHQAAAWAQDSRSIQSPSSTVTRAVSAAARNSWRGTSASSPRPRGLGPAPPGQRLRADDPGAGQVGEGPVHQLQPVFPGLILGRLGLTAQAMTEGPAQLRREAQAALAARVGQRREHLEPPAPGLLGPGHRGVSVAPDIPGRAAVRERDTDAGRQVDAAVGGPERLGGHAGQDALGQLDDLPGGGGVLDQDREHVAAPAGQRAGGRYGRAHPPGHLGEDEVSGAGTRGVVHAGEGVQIDQDHPGHARGSGAAVAEYLPGPLLQVGPVRQPGQPVVVGQVRDLAAQRHLVADVPRGDQQPVRGPLAAVPRDGRLHVPPGPVGRPDPAGIADRLSRSTGHGGL